MTEKRNWYESSTIHRMITEPEIARSIMPMWFVDRMMTDVWYFALLTVSGHKIYISSIRGVSECGNWIDVDLLDEVPHTFVKDGGEKDFAAVCSRTFASINLKNIIMAYEVADT